MASLSSRPSPRYAWPVCCSTRNRTTPRWPRSVAPQFAGAVADRKGDILVAQNKLAEARTAYLAAYEATDKKNPGRQLIQLKLEAIGGSVPIVTVTKVAA